VEGFGDPGVWRMARFSSVIVIDRTSFMKVSERVPHPSLAFCARLGWGFS
jgi:hypothetical protein